MNDAATIGHNQGPPLDDRPAEPRSLPADRARRAADALREMATAFGRLHGPERDAAVMAQARQLAKVGLLNLAAVIEEGAPVVPVVTLAAVPTEKQIERMAALSDKQVIERIANTSPKILVKYAARNRRARLAYGDGRTHEANGQVINGLYSLPRSPLSKADYEAKFSYRCEMCGGEFASSREDSKTCSPACRTALYRKKHSALKPPRWNVLYSPRGKPSKLLGTFDTEVEAEAFARIEQAKIKPGMFRSSFVHVVMARQRPYRKRKRAR